MPIIVETCSQRLYRVIGTLIPNMILSTTCDEYCCCLRLEGEQISELSQKRCFNGYIEVILTRIL